MPYTVTRQLQWPDGNLMIEISEGGFDYVNPDMLSPKYDQEGESFDNPIDAVDTALQILERWRSDEPNKHIGIGYGATLGFTAPFEEADIAELKAWSQKEYDRLPKCDRCGAIITEEYRIYDDPFEMRFCSEYCAEMAYDDMNESD